MGYVEKQRGRYRARYRDPLGRVTSTTFDRRADAQRFLAEIDLKRREEAGSIPAMPTCRWPNGLRSSWRWPAGCLRARRRPTAGT
jgi:hypothetical protein